MMNGTESSSMPINPDVEGRIGEDHGCSLAIHEHRVAFRVKTVSTEDTMPTKNPKITKIANLHRRFRLRQFVRGVVRAIDRSASLDHEVDLSDFKSRDFNVKINFFR